MSPQRRGSTNPLEFICGPNDLCRADQSRESTMLDIILIASGIGFFIVAILYEFACDRV